MWFETGAEDAGSVCALRGILGRTATRSWLWRGVSAGSLRATVKRRATWLRRAPDTAGERPLYMVCVCVCGVLWLGTGGYGRGCEEE